MAEMTGGQWREWERFFDREPSLLGGFHDELRWGLLLSAVMNANRAKDFLRPEDVLPSLKAEMRDRPPLSPEEQSLRWRAAAAASGGRVVEAGG